MGTKILAPVDGLISKVEISTIGAIVSSGTDLFEIIPTSDELIIEPYANPFRLYALRNDYNKFKDLFTNTGVDCYVLNTGYFMDKKVTPKMTLGLIEKIVSDEIKFKQLDKLKEIKYVDIEGFNHDFNNKKYKQLFIKRLNTRIDYINNLHGNDQLPEEASKSIVSIIDRLK